ncbi:MAG: gluconeogenesis factor YvcK family protein [Patescibacteria group bacterium]|jgi:uncharacterized cofD-like protein
MKKTTPKKIVIIGGGTGTATVLKGLRQYPLELSAVVSMADDGGSTGILRRELGILPVGDIRQCLLALSDAEDSVKELFGYRFAEGSLSGHSAGNLLLAALVKSTGDFEEALAVASRMLDIKGEVIPVTLDLTTLGVIHGSDRVKVMGEHVIDDGLVLNQPREFFLEPRAQISSRARTAILDADVIVIGPGSLATSLIPALIVEGVRKAIGESKAKIIYNVNLAPTPGQTEGFSVADYVKEIESYLPRKIDFVTSGDALRDPSKVEKKAGDLLVRSSVRHNPEALGRVIMEYIEAL